MTCTSSHYPLANHTTWTNVASPIITMAPVIHRNHLHILCGKISALSQEQHVARSTILTGSLCKTTAYSLDLRIMQLWNRLVKSKSRTTCMSVI